MSGSDSEWCWQILSEFLYSIDVWTVGVILGPKRMMKEQSFGQRARASATVQASVSFSTHPLDGLSSMVVQLVHIII